MKFLYIIVLLATLYEVHGGSKRMCGSVLVQLLESICYEGYNKMITKKSVPLGNDLDIMSVYNDIEDEAPSYGKTTFLDDMLIGGEHVNTVAKTRRRRNLLGIYDECCVKGCSFDELRSYCK